MLRILPVKVRLGLSPIFCHALLVGSSSQSLLSLNAVISLRRLIQRRRIVQQNPLNYRKRQGAILDQVVVKLARSRRLGIGLG